MELTVEVAQKRKVRYGKRTLQTETRIVTLEGLEPSTN